MYDGGTKLKGSREAVEESAHEPQQWRLQLAPFCIQLANTRRQASRLNHMSRGQMLTGDG